MKILTQTLHQLNKAKDKKVEKQRHFNKLVELIKRANPDDLVPVIEQIDMGINSFGRVLGLSFFPTNNDQYVNDIQKIKELLVTTKIALNKEKFSELVQEASTVAIDEEDSLQINLRTHKVIEEYKDIPGHYLVVPGLPFNNITLYQEKWQKEQKDGKVLTEPELYFKEKYNDYFNNPEEKMGGKYSGVRVYASLEEALNNTSGQRGSPAVLKVSHIKPEDIEKVSDRNIFFTKVGIEIKKCQVQCMYFDRITCIANPHFQVEEANILQPTKLGL